MTAVAKIPQPKPEIPAGSYYEVLGVGKKATPEEITRAYRSKAMEFHPDRKGADRAKFDAVQAAYEVLGNPERRAAYDKGEETESVDNRRANALEEIASLFLLAVEALDVDREDIVAAIIGACQKSIESIRAEQAKERRAIEKRRKAIARISGPRKDDADPIVTVLARDIAKRERVISLAEKSVSQNQMMIEILRDYRYKVDDFFTSYAAAVSRS